MAIGGLALDAHHCAMDKEVVQFLTVAVLVVGFFLVVRWLARRGKDW